MFGGGAAPPHRRLHFLTPRNLYKRAFRRFLWRLRTLFGLCKMPMTDALLFDCRCLSKLIPERAAAGKTDVNGSVCEGNIRALAFHFQAGAPAESKVCGERLGRSFAGCLATLGPDSHGFFLRRSNRLRYPDSYNLILG